MEAMGLKVLITGASGFIGSNMVSRMVDLGWEIFVLVRRGSEFRRGHLNTIQPIHFMDEAEFFVSEKTSLKRVPQFDVCFHLAAYGVDHTQQNFDDLVDGNIKFTMKVLEACKHHGVKKIITTGSCFEYGMNAGGRLSEVDSLFPQSNYAIMKVACESMSLLYAQRNKMNLISVRPFGVYGEGEGFHRLVPQLMSAVLTGQSMKMTGGEQIRDYLYIEDVVEAYKTLALTEVEPYGVYNIASGQGVSIKEMAFEIKRIGGSEAHLFDFGALPYRENEVMSYVGDASKISKDTAWRPQYSLEAGLTKTYEWYKANLEVLK